MKRKTENNPLESINAKRKKMNKPKTMHVPGEIVEIIFSFYSKEQLQKYESDRNKKDTFI